jgi:aromatic ring-opening dioxygenase LigB subunit
VHIVINSVRKEEVEKLMVATDKVITETKAEAYKEFADRLKELKEMPLITNNDIDNLLKELVGEDK